jgi:hypothetical protein
MKNIYMKILNIFILFILTNLTVFGTEQIPDKIIYNGKEYKLGNNPLESYFEKYPDKRPGAGSTALWRGYVATFEIKDNQLYLKDIEIQIWDTVDKHKTTMKSVLNELFPNQDLIKMDWMTGLLLIPYGEIVSYGYLGNAFEHYIVLEIDKGELKKEKQFDYREYLEFTEKQILAIKETEEYEKIKETISQKWNKNYEDEDIDAFLRGDIIGYSSKILVE